MMNNILVKILIQFIATHLLHLYDVYFDIVAYHASGQNP